MSYTIFINCIFIFYLLDSFCEIIYSLCDCYCPRILEYYIVGHKLSIKVSKYSPTGNVNNTKHDVQCNFVMPGSLIIHNASLHKLCCLAHYWFTMYYYISCVAIKNVTIMDYYINTNWKNSSNFAFINPSWMKY